MRVWTPDMDPRNKGEKPTEALPPTRLKNLRPKTKVFINELFPDEPVDQPIDINSAKISLTIDGHELPRNILPPEGAPGTKKATVMLQFNAGEIKITAIVKAKSYREALKKIDAAPHGAIVVLQGKLYPGGSLVDGGFAVQPIKLKEPKPTDEPKQPDDCSGIYTKATA